MRKDDNSMKVDLAIPALVRIAGENDCVIDEYDDALVFYHEGNDVHAEVDKEWIVEKFDDDDFALVWRRVEFVCYSLGNPLNLPPPKEAL
jgi:hypothetical protein